MATLHMDVVSRGLQYALVSLSLNQTGREALATGRPVDQTAWERSSLRPALLKTHDGSEDSCKALSERWRA